MLTTSWAYRATVRLGMTLAPAIGLFEPKILAGHHGRRDAGRRLLDWAKDARDPDRPLVWFHAASVGEGLQAESVIGALRSIRPDCQLVYTHFSPSAEELAGRLAVDVADYLPYDIASAADRLLQALGPDLLVFAKLDVWPELATKAARRGTDVAIVAATVRLGSGRLRWPAKKLLRPGYQAVAAAAAISSEDATRLASLGVKADRIRVLGDPRFDSVAAKVGAISPAEPLLRFGHGGPTMVAGSTWPADEAVILQAFSQVHRLWPDARLILVPHEPTAHHLEQLDRMVADAGLPPAVRLSAADGAVPLLVVDRVGILATLYGAGVMAYVGGGFGRAGLHSTLEPAVWSLPVIFGPRWGGNRDAALLLGAGAGVALPRSGVSVAADALRTQWEAWIADDAGREAQGRRARRVVEEGLGASERSAQMLAELISARPLRRSPLEVRSGRRSAQ